MPGKAEPHPGPWERRTSLSRVRWVLSQRRTGPPGKTEGVFQKENIHSSPESKTNTFTMTAWPRWPLDQRERKFLGTGKGTVPKRVGRQMLVGPTENKHLHSSAGLLELLSDIHQEVGVVEPTSSCR